MRTLIQSLAVCVGMVFVLMLTVITASAATPVTYAINIPSADFEHGSTLTGTMTINWPRGTSEGYCILQANLKFTYKGKSYTVATKHETCLTDDSEISVSKANMRLVGTGYMTIEALVDHGQYVDQITLNGDAISVSSAMPGHGKLRSRRFWELTNVGDLVMRNDLLIGRAQ